MESRLDGNLRQRYAHIWPQHTANDLLQWQAELRPDQVAVSDGRQALTFAQLRRRTEQVARGLINLGIRPGDRVILQLVNSVDYVVALFGISRARAIPTLIHLPWRQAELEHCLTLTEPRAAIIPNVYRGTNFPAIYRELAGRFSCLEHLIVAGGEAPEGTVEFSGLGAGSGVDLSEVCTEPDDVFFLMFTSGTTGRPKAVMHTHNTILTGFKHTGGLWNFSPTDIGLIPTPLSHSFGFGTAILSLMLSVGGHMRIMERWEMAQAVEIIERERISFLIGPPALLADLANNPDIRREQMRSVKSFTYAGAPCPVAVVRQLRERFGCQVSSVYGLTEAGFVVCTRFEDDIETVSATIGRPIPDVEVELRDESGKAVPEGESGELWVRAPNLFTGYFRQPEATAAKFDADGWMRTGDLMVKDPQGNFRYLSRSDDVINRGGVKIDPMEVEHLIQGHEAVKEVAVVGMPDERLGERSCAFIVARPGQSVEMAGLVDFLTARGLAKYKLPDRVEVVDALPYTYTAKIQRNVLRERLRSK